MNVYISCDMEGTAGLCSWKQCDPSDTHEYPVFRSYMTQEVRAAIEGAREGGARRIVVNDSHWSMRNLLLDQLPADDDLRIISGAPKPWSMMQGFAAGNRRGFLYRLSREGRRRRDASPHLLRRRLSRDRQRHAVQRGVAQRGAGRQLRRSRRSHYRRPHDRRRVPARYAVGDRRRREGRDRILGRELLDAAGSARGDFRRRTRGDGSHRTSEAVHLSGPV